MNAGIHSEPDQSFFYATIKLQRASQHIRELRTLCEIFLNDNPPKVDVNIDPYMRNLLVSISPPETMTAAIPCAAGDAAHNIRAALDYCWMGLVRKHDPSATKRTFPFSKDFKSLEGKVKKDCKDLGLTGLEDLVLDKAKTYKHADGFLYAINALDNRDKHNLLVSSVFATRILHMTLANRSGRTMEIRDWQVVSNSAVCPVVVDYDPSDPLKVQGNPGLAVEVFISDGVGLPRSVVPFFTGALNEAAQVVELFQSGFGSKP